MATAPMHLSRADYGAQRAVTCASIESLPIKSANVLAGEVGNVPVYNHNADKSL